jgi:O-antigen ligase
MSSFVQTVEQANKSKQNGIFWLICLVLPILITTLFASDNFWGMLILLGIPLFLLCLFNFQLSLYVLVASWFFYYRLFSNSGIQVADFVLVSVILSYLSKSVLNGTLNLKKTPLDKSIFLFLLILALSLINATNLLVGLRNYLRHIQLFALFYVVANGVRKEEIVKYLKFFLFLSILNSFYVIILFIASGGNIRSFGLAHVPFANIVVAALMICYSFYIYQENTKDKIKFGLLFFILVFALLATYTRSALLYFVIGYLLLTTISLGKAKTHKRLAKNIGYAIIMLFLVAGVLFPTFGSYSQGLSHKMYTAVKPMDTIQIRLYLISLAWQAFLHSPIFGIGLAQFTVISSILPKLRFDPVYMLTLEGMSTHNLTFSYLAETGIVGLMGLYYFIFSFLKLGWINYKHSLKREDLIISLALLGAIVAGEWSFTTVNGMQFMFFLGLSVVWYRNLNLFVKI